MNAPDPAPAAVFFGLHNSKISDRHRDRLALVYVRQSSPQQVLQHQESTARQYALADYAVALGWPAPRVLVIDEDQGRSGRSADDRAGFQRLLAEVTMNHVGIVLGLEMSRLARSSKDWHHLIEVCALFGTLLGDQDGVYDPQDPNDRLLLGLKGTMSEAELFTMRNRLERGRLHKAQRGELFPGGVPLGYVKVPGGGLAVDPDEQVQTTLRLIFDKFDELGTAWAVFRYLAEHGIRLGYRVQRGAQRGQLDWRPPQAPALLRILKHPVYAGAYTYGRTSVDPTSRVHGRPRRQHAVAPSEWKVLKQDQVPAYISWERYLANQERLRHNGHGADRRGSPRGGGALLTGLIFCGGCGRRLHVSYSGGKQAHYHCTQHLARGTAPTCFGMRAAAVDELVSAQLLRALEPAALALSLQAAEDIETERQRLEQHWQQRRERARFEAERAERQYQAVEPENRLVARTLEQRWDEALRQQTQLEEEYARWRQHQPARLTAAERARVQALAEDVPQLWRTATPLQRKEIVRCLVERVEVRVTPYREQVGVTIQWQGGRRDEHEVIRPVRCYEQLAGYEQLRQQLRAWSEQGVSAAEMAARLNAAGTRTPRQRGEFRAEQVRKLLSRWGLTRGQGVPALCGEQEWLLAALGREVGVSAMKLREWLRRGWLHGRLSPDGKLWIAWADADEVERLRQLQARSQRGVESHPAELTTPKARDRQKDSSTRKKRNRR